jgi:transposase
MIGPFNFIDFKEFLEDALNQNVFFGDIIVIMDNVRFHKTIEIKNFFIQNNIKFDYLPPYSPALNPIEEFISCLKNRYFSRRPLADSTIEIIRNVESVLIEMNNDVELNIENFYRNMKTFLDKAFAGEFI